MSKENEKLPYSKPALVCYGKVSELTLVKSVGPAEGAKGSLTTRMGKGIKILPGMDGGGMSF
jgi:hypothetical protein